MENLDQLTKEELIELIKDLQEKKKYKIKSLTPNISQLVLRKLANYTTERLSIDIWYLTQAIQLLIAEVGEEWLKKEMKKENMDWDQIKEKFIRIQKCVLKAKNFYDGLQDKTLRKKKIDEVESMLRVNFTNYLSRIPLISENIYILFAFLYHHTDLHRMRIKSQYFQVLEHHKFQKIDLTKKPKSYEDVAKRED